MVLVGVGCDCVVCMSWRMGRWAREMKRKAQVKRVTTTRRPQASEWHSWWTDLNRRRRYLEVSWADMVVVGGLVVDGAFRLDALNGVVPVLVVSPPPPVYRDMMLYMLC